MLTAAIETKNLSKVYRQKVAVQNVTFRVNPGEVYALVGPNGAGKTTIIRLVAGLAFPSSGEVYLAGSNPHEKPQVRRKLGAVVEAPAAFYPYMTGRGNLNLHADLAGNVTKERISEVLEMMGLSNAADRKVGTYSLGMRQRLGVASALLTRPEVLILDEPASGMDPLSLHLVHSVLRQAAENGTAVLLSTHHLDEVVAYCSRVAILEEGKLIDEVNLLDRRDRYRARVSDAHRAAQILNTQPYIRHASARGNDVIFMLGQPEGITQVATVLIQGGIRIAELGKDIFDLRSYYRERVQDKRAERESAQVMSEALNADSVLREPTVRHDTVKINPVKINDKEVK
ncbi:MAG: ABC transporter ATP-binding protein [Trueperaceae bacterium]